MSYQIFGTYVWIHVTGNVKLISNIGALCTVFLHPVKYTRKDVHTRHRKEEQPGNLEDSRAKVEHNVVLNDSVQGRCERILRCIK